MNDIVSYHEHETPNIFGRMLNPSSTFFSLNFRDCETEAPLGIYCADLSEWGLHLKVKLCLIYGNHNYKNYYSDRFLGCPILIFQLNIAAEY